MKSQGNSFRQQWRVLRSIGLCGALAFVISVASPADDQIQQECMAGRTRQHAAHLPKVIHRDTNAGRNLPAKALAVSCGQQQPVSTPTSIEIDPYQLPDAILAHQTGDRSPPSALL